MIKLISKKFVECDSDNLNCVAKFNFNTLQDALLYIFDVFNNMLYKMGGPTSYGSDYRHQSVPVPLVTRDFDLPTTSRL